MQQASERIAHLNLDFSAAKDAALNQYLDAISHAHAGEDEQREAIEKQKKIEGVRASESFRIKKVNFSEHYIQTCIILFIK